MDRWRGKIAVVTGAGSGIGAAVATTLVEHGVIVVGLDKSEKSLQELLKQLGSKKDKFHILKVDLRKESDVLQAFAWIENHLGGIHILVNCAGLLGKVKSIEDNETEVWRELLDVNVLALTVCSREALRSMKKHGINDGNIVNIASIAASMSRPLTGVVMYTASKKAVQSITEGIRVELAQTNSNIKVTTICPGVTNTSIFEAGGTSLNFNKPYLDPQNIADAIVFCLGLPPKVQITNLLIQPVGEDLIPSKNSAVAKYLQN